MTIVSVKAKDQVTLATLPAPSYVRLYYLKQASTLAPPGVPTTNPPASPWSTAEPVYTEGSTDTVYTVMVTAYGSLSFEYGPVQKSASFEAAKAAYNKAVSAGAAAGGALHVANLAQAAAEGLLTIGSDEPAHGPGRVWMQTNDEGALTGLYQSVSGEWATYTIITGVLIVPGADGVPMVVDQNGMVIGSIAAESITGVEIAAGTITASHLVVASIGREYLSEEAQGVLDDAQAWAALTILEPGRITITAEGDKTSFLTMTAGALDFVLKGKSRAYIDAQRNLMSIGNALIQDTLQVGKHAVKTLPGTTTTVFQYVN